MSRRRSWRDGPERLAITDAMAARMQEQDRAQAAYRAEMREQVEMAKNGSSTVVIAGNLGRDAELDFKGQTARLTFSVAVSLRERDGEHTDWYRCGLFGKRAEALAQYLTKGTTVEVAGALKLRTYQKSDGSEGVSLDVKVYNITLLGGGQRQAGGGGYGGQRGGGSQGGGWRNEGTAGTAYNAQRGGYSGGPDGAGDGPDSDNYDDSDIPFAPVEGV